MPRSKHNTALFRVGIEDITHPAITRIQLRSNFPISNICEIRFCFRIYSVFAMPSVLSLEIARALFPALTKDQSLISSSTEYHPSSSNNVDPVSRIKLQVSADVKSSASSICTPNHASKCIGYAAPLPHVGLASSQWRR